MGEEAAPEAENVSSGKILAGGSRWICFVAAALNGCYVIIVGIVDWCWRGVFFVADTIF